MIVIEAPNNLEDFYKGDELLVWCFLAGGITDCPDWQDEVIKELEKYEDTEDLVVFNPRRKSFDVTDKSASEKQIEWEFYYLTWADIFSMYFSSGKSAQPICMYELGRNLLNMQENFSDYLDRVIVSVEDGYSRVSDVVIQTKLAVDSMQGKLSKGSIRGNSIVNLNATPKSHAEKIYKAYKNIVGK